MAIDYWNLLTEDMVSSEYLDTFKGRLGKHCSK